MGRKNNLLDYVPQRNQEMKWEKDEKNTVIIHVFHKGFWNRLAQTIFKRPKESRIELDKMGSYVWEQIDGFTDIYTIGKRMKEEFAKEHEMVYDRLAEYMKTLWAHHFIIWKEQGRSKDKEV